MKRVTGLGGVFFKSEEPKKLREWYGKHLGLDMEEWGSTFFWIDPNNPEALKALSTKADPFDFAPYQVTDPLGQSEVLRWIEWHDLNEQAVSLPIDKIVVKMLKG
jgi:hypothetical protein